MAGLMFNTWEVYEYINKFRLPFAPVNPRCHSNKELEGDYIPDDKIPEYYQLTVCEKYDWEHFRVPLGEEESISTYLRSINQDVRKHVTKEAKLYDEMQWREISRRANLKYLYNKSEDKNLQHIYGDKYRQTSFADFVRYHLEGERRENYKKLLSALLMIQFIT